MMAARRIYHTDEERREARRLANAKYAASEKGRATMARNNASPKAKERYARYRETPKYAAAQERAKQSGYRNRYQTAYKAALRVTAPEKLAARAAVDMHLRRGAIVRPSTCSRCNLTKPLLHAHHHLGYAPEHWLDVTWLCAKCHRAVHLEPPQEPHAVTASRTGAPR